MSALYCIHWVHKSRLLSSPKLLGRSESERASVHGEETSKLHRREFKAERGLILSQAAAVHTMRLSESVRAYLRACVNVRTLPHSHTHAHTSNPLSLHTCTNDPSSTRLFLSVSLQRMLVCLCIRVCVCVHIHVSVCEPHSKEGKPFWLHSLPHTPPLLPHPPTGTRIKKRREKKTRRAFPPSSPHSDSALFRDAALI